MSQLSARVFTENAAYFWYRPWTLDEAMTANSFIDTTCEMLISALAAEEIGKVIHLPSPREVYARAQEMFDAKHLKPFEEESAYTATHSAMYPIQPTAA